MAFRDRVNKFIGGVKDIFQAPVGFLTDTWAYSQDGDGLSGQELKDAMEQNAIKGISGFGDVYQASGLKGLLSHTPWVTETAKEVFDETELLWNHQLQREREENPALFDISNKYLGTDFDPGEVSVAKGIAGLGGGLAGASRAIGEGENPFGQDVWDMSTMFEQAENTSPGQMIFDRATGLSQLPSEQQKEIKNSWQYVMSTGIMDGMARWKFDPLVVGGKAGKRYGESQGHFVGVEKVYGKTKKKIQRALGRELKGLDDIKSESRAYDAELGPALKDGENMYLVMDADEARGAGLWDDATELNLRDADGKILESTPLYARSQALVSEAGKHLPPDSPILQWSDGGEIYHYIDISKNLDVATSKSRELFDFFFEYSGGPGTRKLREILNKDNSKLPNANDLKTVYKLIDDKWDLWSETSSAGKYGVARMPDAMKKAAKKAGLETKGIEGSVGSFGKKSIHEGKFYDMSKERAKEIVTELFLRKIDEGYPGASTFTERVGAQTGQAVAAGEKGKVIFKDKNVAIAAAKADTNYRMGNQKVEASLGKFDMENPTVIVEINPEGLPVIIPRWDADGGWVLSDVNKIEKSMIVNKKIYKKNDLDYADVNYSPEQLTNQIGNLGKSIMKELKGKIDIGDNTLSAINAYKYADGSPYIHISLDLLPEFQKQGIATKYLDRIIDFADSRGVKIEADLSNFDIWPWLERKGFKVSTKEEVWTIVREARKAGATDLPLSFWSDKGMRSPKVFENLDEARKANADIVQAYEDGSSTFSEGIISNNIMKKEYGDTGLVEALYNHPRILNAVEIMEGKKSAGLGTKKGPMGSSEIHNYFFKNVPDGDVMASVLHQAKGTEAKMEVLLAFMGVRLPKTINGVPGEVMNDLYRRNLEMAKLKDRINAVKAVTETTPDSHVRFRNALNDEIQVADHVKVYRKITKDGELKDVTPNEAKTLQEIDDLIESKFTDRPLSTSVDEYLAMNSDEAQKALLDLELQEAYMKKADILQDKALSQSIAIASADEMAGMLQHVPYASFGKRLQYSVRTNNAYQTSPLLKPVRSVIEMQPRKWMNLSASDGHQQISLLLKEANSRFGQMFTPDEITKYMDGFLNRRRDTDRFQHVLRVTEDIITRVAEKEGLNAQEIAEMITDMNTGVNKTKNFLESRRYGPQSSKEIRSALAEQGDDLMKQVSSEVGHYGDTVKYWDPEAGQYVQQVMPLMGTQLANWVPLTDLRLLQQEVRKRSQIYSLVGYTKGKEILEASGDSFYSVWKPTVLLRGGWPIRFVADEQMRILAKGISLLDHIMAISKTEKVGHKIWDNQVIKALGDSKSTAAGAAAGLILSSPVRIGTQGLVLTSKVMNKFIELIPGKKQKSHLMDQIGGELEPLVSARAGFATPTDNILEQYASFFTKQELTLANKYKAKAKTGQYQPIAKGEKGYATGWLRALNYQIMGDPLGRRAVKSAWNAVDEALEIYPNATTDQVLAIMQRNMHKEFHKYFKTEKGVDYVNQMPWRGEGVKGARWVEDWSDDILDMVAQYTMLATSGPTKVTRDLLKQLYAGKLSTSTLNKIPDQFRPAVIHGEEIAQIFGNDGMVRSFFKGFAVEGFEGFGRLPSDVLSRNPMLRSLFANEVGRRSKLAIKQGQKEFTVADINRITRQAKKGAIEETQRYMYNIAETPRAASTMVRFLIPFLGANVEILKVWSGLIRRDPSIIGRANLIWQSPERAINTPDGFFQGAGGGYTIITEDDKGRKYLTFTISEAYLEDKDLYGWKKYLANSQYKFGKNSFNMVTQNPIGNGGPIVQMAFNELAIKNPELEKTAIGEFVLGWGVKGGEGVHTRILGGQSPAVRTVAEELNFVGDYDGQKRKITNDVITYIDTQVRLGEVQPMRPEEIIDMANKVWWTYAIVKYFSPSAPIVESPLVPYIEAYRGLVEQYGSNEGTEQFIKQYGDEFFAVTKGRTTSKTGIPPTQEAEEAREPFKKLLLDNPEYSRVILGDIYDVGEFSSAVYAAQMSSTIDREFGAEMLKLYGPEREYKEYTSEDFLPDGRLVEVDVDLGWQKYGKIIDEVEAYRIQYGFPNLRVKEAAKLKAWKDEKIKNLKEEHPGWAEDYDTPPNTQAWNNKIKDLERIVEAVLDPSITADPTTRPDLIALMTYLDLRAEAKSQLSDRRYKTLEAQANSGFKEAYLKEIDKILDKYPEFISIYYRYLEGDNLK